MLKKIIPYAIIPIAYLLFYNTSNKKNLQLPRYRR